MFWLTLDMAGPNIPIIGWIEYVLGSLGIMGGIVMAATDF
jgi:hypothetical protein